MTQQEIRGHKLNVPSNPPDVTYQPWQHVCLVNTFISEWTPKVKDISDLIKKQLDPSNRGFNQVTTGDGRFIIQFKLQQIRTWNLTGKTIALSVEDFTSPSTAAGGRDQLCGLVDTGTQLHTPALGYRLPVSHQNIVLRTDDKQGDDFLFNVMCGSRDTAQAYIDILYRFDGPVHAPKIMSVNRELVNSVNKVLSTNERLSAIAENIQAIAELAKEHQPSMIQKVFDSKIVDAIPVVAMSAGSVMNMDSLRDLLDTIALDE